MAESDSRLYRILRQVDVANFKKSVNLHSKDILSIIVDGYNAEYKKMSLSEDEQRLFTLVNQPLTLNIVQLLSPYKDDARYVAFANKLNVELPSKNYVNGLVAYSFEVEKDDSYVFFRKSLWQDQVKYAIAKIKQINPELTDNLVIPESFNHSYEDKLTTLDDWAQRWTEAEFNKAEDTIDSSGFQLEEGVMHFNLSGLHANRYAFNDMLSAIPNRQFHQEVNECLTAYETPLFYVCAAGLSGIIESLLTFTIDNYHFRKKSLPKDPTAYDYLAALFNNSVISTRDLKYLQSTFMLRNSVSHYNSGGVTSELCDRMMSSIQMIFSSIYLTSVDWKKKFNLPPNITFDQWVKKYPSDADEWFSNHSTPVNTAIKGEAKN